MCWQEDFKNVFLMQIPSCSGELIPLSVVCTAVCLANKGSFTDCSVGQSQHFFPRAVWKLGWRLCFQYKPYFQWWEFDYFNIWLISCVLIVSYFVMCVIPKEQFVWKFSNLLRILVFTWTVLRILIQLLEEGIHSHSSVWSLLAPWITFFIVERA